MAAASLEAMLLQACKTGDIEAVRLTTSQSVDVNCSKGWGLRRAIRYNHPQIWDSLLLHRCINVNLCNQYGLSALHTACRFNIGSAVSDLLRHPGIAVNDQTILGSTPLMVAVKYGSKQAVQILIRDKRVDLDIADNHQRSLEDVIGIALKRIRKDDREEILSILQEERRFRQEGKGRRLSLEEEAMPIDSKQKDRVFNKLQELFEELKELQHSELMKVEIRQEEESRQFQNQMFVQMNQLFNAQEQEKNELMGMLMAEKEEMDNKHKHEMNTLRKKQDEASNFLKRRSDVEPPSTSELITTNRQSCSSNGSVHTVGMPPDPVNTTLPPLTLRQPAPWQNIHQSEQNSGDSVFQHQTIQQIDSSDELTNLLNLPTPSDAGVTEDTVVTVGYAGGIDSQQGAALPATGSSSPWDTGTGTPDEGYLTSKDTELPEIIHSTCKELECPICMEVMAPPSRIWQCKMGHVICEACKERVRKESGSNLNCPTCKTAPFIGRNLALERVARSLFLSK